MEAYERIDPAHFARQAHFDFFKEMANPYVGATVNVRIGSWLRRCKQQGQPFFLSFLYEVAAAANAVPQMRQRILEGKVVQFARCPTSHTVMKEDGTWCFCRLHGDRPFAEFLPYAQQRQEEMERCGDIEVGESELPLLFVSSAPWFSFTSLVQPTPNPPDSNPRITWGKFYRQGDETWIPVALLCHHALVDGLHLGQFYEGLQQRLAL